MAPLDQLNLGGSFEWPDDELAAAALAADPDTCADDDAVSLWELEGRDQDGLLPGWYMPVAPTGVGLLHGWRRQVAWFIIITFLVIDAVGLCSTYGPIVFS